MMCCAMLRFPHCAVSSCLQVMQQLQRAQALLQEHKIAKQLHKLVCDVLWGMQVPANLVAACACVSQAQTRGLFNTNGVAYATSGPAGSSRSMPPANFSMLR
jgi:hypothetical protein